MADKYLFYRCNCYYLLLAVAPEGLPVTPHLRGATRSSRCPRALTDTAADAHPAGAPRGPGHLLSPVPASRRPAEPGDNPDGRDRRGREEFLGPGGNGEMRSGSRPVAGAGGRRCSHPPLLSAGKKLRPDGAHWRGRKRPSPRGRGSYLRRRSGSAEASRTEPSQTEPSRTEPSRTEPSRAGPAAAARVAGAAPRRHLGRPRGRSRGGAGVAVAGWERQGWGAGAEAGA